MCTTAKIKWFARVCLVIYASYVFLIMAITAQNFVPHLYRWDENYIPIYPVNGVIFLACILSIGFVIAYAILRPATLATSRQPVLRVMSTGLWLALWGFLIAILYVMHHPNYVGEAIFALFQGFPLAIAMSIILKITLACTR